MKQGVATGLTKSCKSCPDIWLSREAGCADKCGLTRSPGHWAPDEQCWVREWVAGKLTFIICKMRITAGWFENEMTIHIRNLE